ncbi:MAG TPA: cytochrome P450 [Acidimicrobiales bacterium]|nr:cytochrome P450 [Acidimicrobiales bacterium]
MTTIELPTSRPEVDLLDPSFHVGDPHPAYAWMRRHEPIYRDVNGLWCITRMEHVRHVERHASDFISSRGYRSVWFPNETSMISRDDPGHQEQRKLISDLFTPRAVSQLEDDIRGLVRDALAMTRGLDRFEVIDTLAGRLPAQVTCKLLGWPLAHWRDVKSWSERLMRVDMLFRDPTQMSDATRAVMEMAALTHPSVEERRGCQATDILGRWANATLEGCPMSLEQIDSELGLVVPGGAETTRTTLSRSLILFSERNDLWEQLAEDPSRIPTAVEELLRWVTPLNNMFRTVARDVEVDGVRMKEGDRVALVYPSANRDEDWFEDPYEVDLTRDPNPHIAFGFGTHFCLGAHVARLQLRVALEELTSRFTNLRPISPPVYEANVFVKAVERFELGVNPR